MNSSELLSVVNLGRIETGQTLSLILSNGGITVGTVAHLTHDMNSMQPNGIMMDITVEADDFVDGNEPETRPAYFAASSIIGVVWDRPADDGE